MGVTVKALRLIILIFVKKYPKPAHFIPTYFFLFDATTRTIAILVK